jgi:hypothetical protein
MPKLPPDSEIHRLLLEITQSDSLFEWKSHALDELRSIGGPTARAVQQAVRDHLAQRGDVNEAAQKGIFEGTTGYEFRFAVAGVRLYVKIIIDEFGDCRIPLIVGCHPQ